MTPQERLAKVVRLCFGNDASIMADSIGVCPSTVCRLMKGEKKLTRYYVERICRAFPRINPEWLLTGEGYEGDIDIDAVIAKYENLLALKDEEIERYKRIIDRLTI